MGSEVPVPVLAHSQAENRSIDTETLRQDILRSKILIVDDEKINCSLLMNYLNDAGFQNIGFAFNGEEAIEKCRDLEPDLLVLDIIMPGMDGFDVLKVLRSDPLFDDLPIIVQSGDDDREHRAKILSAGASNFISKPVLPELFTKLAYHQIESNVVMRRLKAFQLRMSEELLAATELQRQMLPDPDLIQKIEDSAGVQIDWHFQASSEVGGDIVGLLPLDQNRFSVFLADFTGHGIVAAINTFRFHMTVNTHPVGNRTPAEYLAVLNEQLCSLLPRGQFATLLYAIVDTAAESITYAASGSTPPLFLPASSGTKPFFGESSGIPLGISRKATYEDMVHPFVAGDTMLLYSDALIEEQGEVTPPLGDNGLMSFVNKAESEAASGKALETLITGFYRRYSTKLSDDLSVIRIQSGQMPRQACPDTTVDGSISTTS